MSKVLESVTKLNYSGDLIEILIVADPQDLSAEDIVNKFNSENKSLSIKYIKCPVNSASACRNLGILESSGDIVAIIDDDIYVDALALKRAIEHLQRDSSIACVCYPVITISPSLSEKLHHWKFLGTTTTQVYTVFPVTICWKNILARTGLYREDMGPPLSLHEDWELGSRIRAHGYKILVDGTLKNLHLLHMREEKNTSSARRGSLATYLCYVTKHWKTFFEVMKVSPLSQKIEYLFYLVSPILVLLVLWLAGIAYFVTLLLTMFSLVTLNSLLHGYYSRLRFVERITYPSILFTIRVLRTYLSVAGFVLHNMNRVLRIR